MHVVMQNRYTPYYKPLKISIPESTSMIPMHTHVRTRYNYVPYFHFGNYYNQLYVQPNLPVNDVNQPTQKYELKFGIDAILGLNESKSNGAGITRSNDNNQPEIGSLSSEVSPEAQNYSLARDNSSPTSSSSGYSPSFDSASSTEPEKSRFTFSPESCDSVNSINQTKSPPIDVERSKRVRTIFSADQMARLEQEFSRSQYMVGQERTYLAQMLNLTESQVKIWFQNRRIKWRKQNLVNQKLKLNQCQESESRTI